MNLKWKGLYKQPTLLKMLCSVSQSAVPTLGIPNVSGKSKYQLAFPTVYLKHSKVAPQKTPMSEYIPKQYRMTRNSAESTGHNT
jgi:hypothetical protein